MKRNKVIINKYKLIQFLKFNDSWKFRKYKYLPFFFLFFFFLQGDFFEIREQSLSSLKTFYKTLKLI